ncbi:NAD(P)/FAD-dependent oxidoreductase [Candidatus Saccharibacteria bacterium]|nr:NAD(P)/FAD-dependent oxidoreductase [Candidatus Saccharibacteria bacterium]
MLKKFDYELIIIGSGPAGTAAAQLAARRGVKVALVESGKWGGSALNSTDLPARALFNFSHLYHEAMRGSRFGISSSTLRYNYPTVQNWKTSVSRRSGAGSKKSYEDAKIACFSGFASFLSPNEIAVGDRIISASKFIIATGAKPTSGDISGIESTTCYTPAEALALPRVPKSVFVVGAGSTGVELANYFAELGSNVTIGELADRILPKEDPEIGEVIAKYFGSTLRIKILADSRVVAVQKSTSKPGYQKVIFRRGGLEKSVEVAAIVLATGSKPITNLSLENAGVDYDENGIIVDDTLRTKQKHVYAAGDCIGGESSFERAAYEGTLAASNALFGAKDSRDYDGFIRLTSTFPAVAVTGLTENDCLEKGIKYKKAVLPLSSAMASNITDFKAGLLKLLADPRGKILGASIVCPDAELVIQEVSLAIRQSLTATELISQPCISSSLTELVKLTALTLAK